MKNRVHYGEFTLDYWLDQLISGGIVLPEYQRSFVWSKDQIINLIKSVGKDEFVPPITIGKLDDKNIIIDGQQRLTSIVLAYLNIVPSERRYKKTIKVEGDNEDDELEEEKILEQYKISNSIFEKDKDYKNDILNLRESSENLKLQTKGSNRSNNKLFNKALQQVMLDKRNELLKAGVLRTRPDLGTMLDEQTGGNYIKVPMKGLLDGEVLNYDGSTDIEATSTDTFSQGMIVVGRAKAWIEKDFSYELTGVDFMDNVAEQVSKYFENVDQDTMLSILNLSLFEYHLYQYILSIQLVLNSLMMLKYQSA